MALRIRLVPVILLTLAVSGCQNTPWHAPPCMPPAYTVDPSVAAPGDTVTVSAPDTDCDPRYGSNARVEISVWKVRDEPFVEALAPMNDAGGFSYEFTVPDGAPTGPARVSAYPYNLDWCDDTGRNNRVGAIERAACVERVEPLTIREAAVP